MSCNDFINSGMISLEEAIQCFFGKNQTLQLFAGGKLSKFFPEKAKLSGDVL